MRQPHDAEPTTYPQTNEGGVLHGFRVGYVYYGSIYIVKRVVFCGVSEVGTSKAYV